MYDIYIEFDNAVQGFGGYALDIYDESKKSRVGTAYGMEWIISLMKVLDVKKFEDIKDQYIRIDSSHRKIYRIGHIVKDQWFDPEKMYNEKN